MSQNLDISKLGEILDAFMALKDALERNGLEIRDGEIIQKQPTLDIKAGQWFRCIKDVTMNDGTTDYLKGKVYQSFFDKCITDENGQKKHMWVANAEQYFTLIPKPSFKKGDTLIFKDQAKSASWLYHIIKDVDNENYTFTDGTVLPIETVEEKYFLSEIISGRHIKQGHTYISLDYCQGFTIGKPYKCEYEGHLLDDEGNLVKPTLGHFREMETFETVTITTPDNPTINSPNLDEDAMTDLYIRKNWHKIISQTPAAAIAERAYRDGIRDTLERMRQR